MTQPSGRDQQGLDPAAGEPAREAFLTNLRARMASLPAVVSPDDGSLEARLSDRRGLLDSMLGRDLLDPLDMTFRAGEITDTLAQDVAQSATQGAAQGVSVAPRGGGGSADDGLPDGAASAGDAALLPQVADLLRVVGPVTACDLDQTIDALTLVRSRVNALEALEAVLLERARRQALRASVLDESEPLVRSASGDLRRSLARRAVVADVALAVRATERQITDRMDRAHALTSRAPRTLGAALAGDACWANAAKVADAVGELEPAVAARLDRDVAAAARCQDPRRFAATVRRTRDRLHPTPLVVRHQEAAAQRAVWVDPARDGMAYLTLFAPALTIHAIKDRLDRTAAHLRATGDPRILPQLRADVACALLLDDGTLDLDAATLATTGATGASASADARSAAPAHVPAGGGEASGLVEVGQTGDAGRDGAYASTAPDLAVLARSVRPHVYLTVPVLSLLGRAEEPALLDGTVPIDADTARQLAVLAPSFSRILTHPVTGNVLAMDARTYTPPPGLRRHLVVRDTSCRFPGCQRRAAQTDADHTIAHAAGGPTAAANLALLCRHHHLLKHQARYDVVQHPDGSGTLTWTTPTGRTHTARPESVPATVHTTAPAPLHVPAVGPDGGYEPEPVADDADAYPDAHAAAQAAAAQVGAAADLDGEPPF